MKRSDVDAVKAECARLLERIAIMEQRVWSMSKDGTPIPTTNFQPGQYVAAVKKEQA